MNFWEILFLCFAFQAGVLCLVFLMRKQGDPVANRLIAIYVALFGLNIIYNVLFWSRLLYTKPFVHFNFINILIWVSYGPILFLYIRRLLFRSRFKWYDVLHFIPLVLFFINYSKGYFLSAETKLELFGESRVGEMMYLWTPYFSRIIILQMLVYFGLVFWYFKNKLASYNKRLWLKLLSVSYLGYVLSFTSYFVLLYMQKITLENDYFVGFFMIAFVSLLTYFAYLQPKVFDGIPVGRLVPFLKYQKTGLTPQYSEELKHKLVQIMEKDKPFLDADLRLEDIASKLNLSRHHASQVINEQFDARFFDFINAYRISEAKELLLNDEQASVTEVLYASGFNNRVSFYKAFKKFTGSTPTDFRTSNKIAS